MSRHQGKPSGMNVAPQVYPAETDPSEALASLGSFRGVVQTKTQYHTAVRVEVPREIETVKRGILREAAEMGEDFIYAWDVKDKHSKTGKSRIEGMSIDGALILARNWGNCDIPTELADETASHFLIKATFVDFEKGFSIPRLYRQRKSERRGGMDAERAEDIAFQIAQSKCQRNAIEKALPQWLQVQAITAAKQSAERRYEDVPKAVEEARKYAARLGITDAELERKVGQGFTNWLPSDLVYLRSVFRAISDKQSTIDLEFRSDPEDDVPPGEVVETPAAEPAATGVGFPEIKPEPPAEPTTPPEPKPSEPKVTPAAEPVPPKDEPAPTFTPPTTKKK